MKRAAFTSQDIRLLLNLRKAKKTHKELAEFFGCSTATIYRLLKKHRAPMRPKKYPINTDYFDDIGPDQAYILGLLWADGNHKIKDNKIVLVLQESDKHILESIRENLGSTKPLYEIKPKEAHHHTLWQFSFSDPKISHRLELLGFVLKKERPFPLWLDKELHPHFIRGIIDGDGCVSVDTKRIEIAGNPVVMEKIRNIFIAELGLGKNVLQNKSKDGSCVSLTYKGQGNLQKLYDWLYQKEGLHLFRKKEAFEEALGEKDTDTPEGIPSESS
jgi:hypothetical protein